MKKSKFTDQQIVFALKQAELSTPIDEVCRKLGISQQTHKALASVSRWKLIADSRESALCIC